VNVVGLAGPAGAGKDAVAEILVREHGFARIALADVMKRFARDVFGFSDEQLWGPSEARNAFDKRFPREHRAERVMGRCACCGADLDLEGDQPCFLTPRYALQQLGTEWGRDCFENVWVDYMIRTARELLGRERKTENYWPQRGIVHMDSMWLGPCGVVVSDVRFANEARAVRAAGGKVLSVERAGAGLDGAAGEHESERGVSPDLVDATIDNNGSLDDLPARVRAALTVTLAKKGATNAA
jgi:hypothetical protein